MFPRYFDDLGAYLKPNKVLVLYGPRRVGKTTLLKTFLAETKLKYRFDSGDNMKVQQILNSSDFDLIKEYCEGKDLIVIDEAQNISNIGKALKIIVDEVPGVRVLATGSSSFDLPNKVGEPLVGRQTVLKMFPLSVLELSSKYEKLDLRNKLEEFLIFGFYPEVLTSKTKSAKAEYLGDMVHSFLLKDILMLENVKSSKTLMDLLRLLAFQIGSEVSLNELATQLKIDVKTVARYLDLLEKTFLIISVGGFSRNLRSELVKKKKYYFTDIGIRNGIINAFNRLPDRADVGHLWENFVFMERLKKKSYKKIFSNDFFWRTYAQNEIDLIEERDSRIYAYEFKFARNKFSPPNEWVKAYPETPVELITQENYFDFIV